MGGVRARAGWDVAWIAYGETNRPAAGVVPVVALETGGHLAFARTILNLASSSWRLRRILRRLDPDLVQTHWFLGPAWIAALAGRHPVVATAWGSDVLAVPDAVRRASCHGHWVEESMPSRIALEELKRGLLGVGLHPERLYRVLHGVDPTHFRPLPADFGLLEELGVDPTSPVILSPRRRRSCLRARHRCARVRPGSCPGARNPAHAGTTGTDEGVGDAPRDSGPTSPTASLRFPGVEHDVVPETPRVIRRCHLHVAIGGRVGNGDGGAVVSAPADRLRHPQNREWVRDSRFGTIVPVDDVDALAAAIEDVLADGEGAAVNAPRCVGAT